MHALHAYVLYTSVLHTHTLAYISYFHYFFAHICFSCTYFTNMWLKGPWLPNCLWCQAFNFLQQDHTLQFAAWRRAGGCVSKGVRLDTPGAGTTTLQMRPELSASSWWSLGSTCDIDVMWRSEVDSCSGSFGLL